MNPLISYIDKSITDTRTKISAKVCIPTISIDNYDTDLITESNDLITFKQGQKSIQSSNH